MDAIRGDDNGRQDLQTGSLRIREEIQNPSSAEPSAKTYINQLGFSGQKISFENPSNASEFQIYSIFFFSFHFLTFHLSSKLFYYEETI